MSKSVIFFKSISKFLYGIFKNGLIV